MAYDMTVASPGRTLFRFAVPMVLGNLFQQLYNIIDSMIVGNFVGSDALAAVGASSSITFLFVAVATGLSMGASVIIAQYFGAKHLGDMKTSICTTIITSLLVSFTLSILGILGCGGILKFMNTPENIFADASSYLRIYMMGVVFLFLYNTMTAVFNALGSSKTPLVFLVFSSAMNVVLDLVFVTQFHWGVAGAAIATVIAQGVSCVFSFIWLTIKIKQLKITERFQYYNIRMLKTICRVAIPSMLQQSIVSFGYLAVQTLVNGFGSVVMAGYTAATKIDSIAILPMVNVGNAVSTFTAQNIGAGKTERVSKGLKMGLLMSGFVAVIVSAVLFIWGDVFISAFVDTQTNTGVIQVGVEYLRVVSISYIIMGTMNNLNGILRGAGDMKIFMLSTLLNFTTRVVLAYGLASWIGQNAIWYSIPLGWTVGLLVSFTRYRTGKWKLKKIIPTR